MEPLVKTPGAQSPQPNPTDPSQTLAAEDAKARQAAHTQPPPALSKNKVGARTFYARLDGCAYYFSNGKAARFENGEYVTDKEGEIKELEDLVAQEGQHLISDKPLLVRRSDAL